MLVDPAGDVNAAGDPQRLTFYRSAVKPFQATASLELAGHPDLTDDEVAVGWSSHTAEPAHLDAVRSLCRRAGIDPSQLTSPGDEPLLHNCSGKHALFALAGREVGGPLLDPDEPVQRHALATIREALGTDVVVSVDGCGAPAVAGPLEALARAFRRLVSEDRWRRVIEAGQTRPHLVGGTGRLESALLDVGITAKPGAEGVFAAAWTDDDGPWGLVVKVEDGAGRAASAVVHALLTDRGVRPDWEPPPVLGGGRPVGSVRARIPGSLPTRGG